MFKYLLFKKKIRNEMRIDASNIHEGNSNFLILYIHSGTR